MNRKYVYVDKIGRIVIQPQFGEIAINSEYADAQGINDNTLSSFRLGVAIGGRLGYIDKAGKVVINPQFDTARPFYGGLAFVRIG